jgi:hypothetical protein
MSTDKRLKFCKPLIAFVAIINWQFASGDQTVAQLTNEANESSLVAVAAPEIYTSRTAEDAARDWIQEMVGRGKLPHFEGCQPVNEEIDGIVSKVLTCIGIGVAEVPFADPSFDDSFVTQRTLWGIAAALDARTRIIESIATTITAEDALILPDNPISQQFDQELRGLNATRQRAKDSLVPLVQNVDNKLADLMAGVTTGDRLNALMDAAIKTLDESWDPATAEEAERLRYENAKRAYEEAQQEYDAIEAEIAKYREELKRETTSTVLTKASMPLFGTTPLKTWESYDGKDYQVALVVLWDSKSHTWSKAIVAGKTVPALPAGKKTLNEYLVAKDWSRILLGRRMIDRDGNLVVLGVGAASLDSLTRREAETLANLQAQKNLVFSIFVEQDAESMAEIGEQLRGTGDEISSVAKVNIAQRLVSRVEDRNIPGVTRVYSQRLQHPLTKRDMFVSVYAVGQESLKLAMAAYVDASQLRSEDRWTQDQISRARAEADRLAGQAGAPKPEPQSKPGSEQQEAGDTAQESSMGVITDEDGDDDEDEDW